MSAVLQGALGGARALLIGWFVPSLINLLVFGIVIVPRLSGFQALATSGDVDTARSTVFVLIGTVVLGLALAALQTPLYRILEGYLGWPERLYKAGRERKLADKHLLANRLEAAVLARREAGSLEPREAGSLEPREVPLSEADRRVLARYRAHVVTGRFVASDARRGPLWWSLLDERLARFPSDPQVTATRLGNAIRRFEEYGYDRFRLDSQVLWHELNAAAPEAARKQAEDARMNVDFFVCLLYGHLVVAAAACVELGAGNPGRPWLVAAAIVGLPLLTLVWYRVAVAATDDWAGAVRALVNLGRAPLATSMGLALPRDLADERRMWTLAGGLVRGPYRPAAAALDEFRRAVNPGAVNPGAGNPGAVNPGGGDPDAGAPPG